MEFLALAVAAVIKGYIVYRIEQRKARHANPSAQTITISSRRVG